MSISKDIRRLVPSDDEIGEPMPDLVLGLGPVNLPDYIDRAEMVEVVGEYEVRFSDIDRWIEPLEGHLQRVLAQNLQLRLQPNALLTYPWFDTERVDLQVEIEADLFVRTPDNEWETAIRWVIRDARTNEPLARDRFVLPGRADTIQNGRVIAEQVSVVLAELSGVVANEVRRLHARRSGGLEQD